MSNPRTDRFIIHLRRSYDAARIATDIIAKTTFHEFLIDTLAVFAVTRALDEISRHADHLRRSPKMEQFSSLPWQELASMSYFLNHLYSQVPPAVLWHTVQDELPPIVDALRHFFDEAPPYNDGAESIRMKLASFKLVSETNRLLTVNELQRNVVPYLQALSQLQLVLDKVQGRTRTKTPIFRMIVQHSPVSISADGLAEAAKTVHDLVDPSMRQHAKAIAALEEQEREAKIAALRAEEEQTRAKTRRDTTADAIDRIALDDERLELELENMRLNLEERRLQIDKMRQEQLESRVHLALTVFDRLGVQLSLEQRIAFAYQLLQPLGVLASSEFLLDDLHITS